MISSTSAHILVLFLIYRSNNLWPELHFHTHWVCHSCSQINTNLLVQSSIVLDIQRKASCVEKINDCRSIRVHRGGKGEGHEGEKGSSSHQPPPPYPPLIFALSVANIQPERWRWGRTYLTYHIQLN